MVSLPPKKSRIGSTNKVKVFLQSSLTLLVLTGCNVKETSGTSVKPSAEQSEKNRLITPDLYLRGAFNGWGTNAKFKHLGNNLYVTQVEVALGNYGFKIAPNDWAFEWVVNTQKNQIVKIKTEYPLTKQKSPEDYLFASEPGVYIFELDMSNDMSPVLTIKKAPPTAKEQVDPHKSNQTKLTRTYQMFGDTNEVVTYSINNLEADFREYTHSSSQALRDPGPSYTHYSELQDQPKLRTGDLEFDALFALAVNEMKYLSVSNINDGNYNAGKDITCDCFKTGEKWAYVWTRDLSYAADLSLAMFDPKRVINSLNFKLSGFRNEVTLSQNVFGHDGPQIIQDTGSGGSWPISTDRVTWAFGAEKALAALSGQEHAAFSEVAYEALKNTVENDRVAAFDPVDGLYSGEQSFLDWREQTYAEWIVEDLSSMASSKALSTNVAHYQALKLAAKLALSYGTKTHVQRYESWAKQLKQAINEHLWLEDVGLYSSLTTGHLSNVAMHKYDWLGQSLAIISGIADENKALRVLKSYPHGPMGAPVIFPQQPDIPVYHNRAIWPFVTAYGLTAAAKLKQVDVANEAYNTLIRGAALNLSNMENFEWLTQQPMLLQMDNPALSGPVINSKYQLWSVAAYLNLVTENLFGLKLNDTALSVSPFVTTEIVERFFADQKQVHLQNVKVKGNTVNVTLNLPEPERGNGYFPVAELKLNGQTVTSNIDYELLKPNNILEITLAEAEAGNTGITKVDSDPQTFDPNVFAPQTPVLTDISESNGTIRFTLDESKTNKNESVKYNVYRGSTLVVENALAEQLFEENSKQDACYTIEAVYPSGNRSHHTQPICLGTAQFIDMQSEMVESNKASTRVDENIQQTHIKNWGDDEDLIKVTQLRIESDGHYAIQLQYHNDSHSIGQGISAGVKWLSIKNQNGKIIKEGVVQLPHAKLDGKSKPLVYSTPVYVELPSGAYQLSISDFFNMSYLKSNQSFTNAGGLSGVRNHFDIAGIRILPFSN